MDEAVEKLIKELVKVTPIRQIRKQIKKNLKEQYLGGVITKREYKKAKRKLKVLIRGLPK